MVESKKTKIEWVRNQDGSQGYTINPVKGLCPMACSYCYARRLYKRFRWNPEIRYDPSVFRTLPQKPSRIFVGSTMELFGGWIKYWWLKDIFMKTQINPHHTFIFLTKQPQNLVLGSPFPDNCWVGTSACDKNGYFKAIHWADEYKAKIKFISFEPLLENPLARPADLLGAGINWVIIGQQTPATKKTEPKLEWVREIVETADMAGIPVFLKFNLLFHSLWTDEKCHLRQEFPRNQL